MSDASPAKKKRESQLSSSATDRVASLIPVIRERLVSGRRVRRSLMGGRVHVDRLLPFLVLYRAPIDRLDVGLKDLATTEASYLVSSLDKRSQAIDRAIAQELRDISIEHFGAFLIVELWSRPAAHPIISPQEGGRVIPGFRLYAWPEDARGDEVIETLSHHLRAISIMGQDTIVDCPEKPNSYKKRREPILGRQCSQTVHIGIEIEPCFLKSGQQEIYPTVLRSLRAGLSKALRHTFFRFTQTETTQSPANFHVLGRNAVVKAVWEIDRELDRISSSYDFLLAINPNNSKALWQSFKQSNFEKLPSMRYNPIPVDTALSKRALFSIPVEKVEDPTLANIFSEKQEELDRQLTMLKDRGTKRFVLGGNQLYGVVSKSLMRTAEELLERVPSRARALSAGRPIKVDELVQIADKEIDYYRGIWSGVRATTKISKAVVSGLMCSQGHLLISADTKTPSARVEALLQHEIGTHLVTYYNGDAQRLTQLRNGLAGYEELQEGLAVLAEYLCGGMTPARLRTLAARVIAAKAVVDGASFVDTFRVLCRYGFSPEPAFNITLRIYRGGGLIKDCVYLRGFQSVLDYLQDGQPLERLFVGKIALKHIPLITELENRKVLTPPKLMPRYLTRSDCQRRLAGLRTGRKIYELIKDE